MAMTHSKPAKNLSDIRPTSRIFSWRGIFTVMVEKTKKMTKFDEKNVKKRSWRLFLVRFERLKRNFWSNLQELDFKFCESGLGPKVLRARFQILSNGFQSPIFVKIVPKTSKSHQNR
jgi:hypothetical protein